MRVTVSRLRMFLPLIIKPISRGFISVKRLPPLIPLMNLQTSKMSTYRNEFHSKFEGQGFYVEQMLTGCLALYSYYIESQNEALIIDPQNDITQYAQVLTRRNKKLKGVFLSHYHADYIAGHHQLQKKYNCTIYMGPNSLPQPNIKILKDREQIKIGAISLELLHTPGHTNESSCLLLKDKNGKQASLFTGDTLFLNQVGRPDLAVTKDVSAIDLAFKLFQSLEKIKKLNDDIRIYPGHGAGSSCGKNIGSGDFCTLGTQKINNYALKMTQKKSFAQKILKEMPNPPQYFGYDVSINKFHPFSFDQAYEKVKEISSNNLAQIISKQQITIIDVRPNNILTQGIIKGSVCFGFEGPFANWVGTLLNPSKKYIIYGMPDQIQDTIKRLLRIGYVNIVGFCKFGVQQMKKSKLVIYDGDFLDGSKIDEDRQIIDLRKPQQLLKGTLNVKNLIKLQLSNLSNNLAKLDKNKKYSVHCASGYRAKIAYSILKNEGFDVKAFVCTFQKLSQLNKGSIPK